MNRTQRLEAALRGLLEVCACENGCESDDMTCATNVARAALADTSPSCCDETRQVATEDERECWLAMLAFGPRSEINTPEDEAALAAHDAEVRRAALEEAAAAVAAFAERPGKAMSGTNRNYLYRARDAVLALSNQAPTKSQADGAPKSVTVPMLPVDDAAEARYEKLLAERHQVGLRVRRFLRPEVDIAPEGTANAIPAPPVCPTCGRRPDLAALRSCPDCGGGK